MRKNFLNYALFAVSSLFLLFSSNSAFAQQKNNYQPCRYYLGLGLGINDLGLGLNVEMPIDKISIYGHAGLGGWGYKFGGGLNFYLNNAQFGSSISIGYVVATGLDDFETDLTVEPDGETEKIQMDLNNVGTINLMYSYSWHMGKGKFVLNAGYAIAVTDNPYVIHSEETLDDVGKQVMEIVQPGGVIIGLRFMFGKY